MEKNQIVATCGSGNGIATIRDISEGGIKLQYVPIEEKEPSWSKINIFSAVCDRIYMTDVKCRPVYDFTTLMEGGTYTGMNVRMSGLCFRDLTESQETALRRFLKYCAWCHLEDR